MSKKILIKLISEMLREKLSFQSIRNVERLLKQGALMTVFPEAVDKAILDSIADNWQKEHEGKQVEGKL